MEQEQSRHVHRIGNTDVDTLLSLDVPNHDPSLGAKIADTADANSTADSAYQSFIVDNSTDTVSTTTDRPNLTTTRVFTIPGKDVLRFLKPPDPRYLAHYYKALAAIQWRLQAAVARVATHGQVLWDDLVFQPMVVGKNEEEAKLHMAVLCKPALAWILEAAFQHGPVQSELGIPYTTEAVGYIVIPEPFDEVNAELPIEIFSAKDYAVEHSTHCGAPLLVRRHGDDAPATVVRQSTFGGVIKVLFANGETRFYGMTAGHVIKDTRQHRFQLSTSMTSKTDTVCDPFSIGAWLSSEEILSRPLDPARLPGVQAQRAHPSHDWCLFEVQPTYFNKAIHISKKVPTTKADILPVDENHSIVIAERPTFNDDTSDPVLILGAAAGSRSGVLSAYPASIWMSSCQKFISVYVLQMDGNQKIMKGDSGAWVVHAAGPALYGHVVATNTFGEAYVVPSNDTFENIRECLGAASVALPSVSDASAEPLSYDSVTAWISPKQSSEPTSLKRITDDEQAVPSTIPEELQQSKVWPPIFFEERYGNERPYLDTLQGQDTARDLLEVLLSQTSTPRCWDTCPAQRLLEAADKKSGSLRPRIRIDDRGSHIGEISSGWFNAEAIHSHMSQARWRTPNEGECRRKLVFVPELKTTILTALVASASWREAQDLRHAIQMYSTSAIVLGVQIPSYSSEIFRLEFNISYLVLRPPSTSRTPSTRVSMADLDGIEERQITLLIRGCSNHSWTGYAFGLLCPGDASLVSDDSSPDSDDSSLDSDEETSDGFFEEDEDIFATGGCEHVIQPGNRIWDPRVYFLRAVQLRLAIIVQGHAYMVQTLDAIFREWSEHERGRSHKLGLLTADTMHQSISGIKHVVRLFGILRDRFQEASSVWERFSCRHDSDLLYFSDLQHPVARNALHKIEESFERLKTLEMTVTRLRGEAQNAAEMLHLQMSQAVNMNTKENAATSRAQFSLDARLVELVESAAASAASSAKAAEETSRVTRINIQLLVLTTCVVMLLQYFTADRTLFAFERTPRNFWISVCFLIPLLSLIVFMTSYMSYMGGYIRRILTGWTEHAEKMLREKSEPSCSPPC